MKGSCCLHADKKLLPPFLHQALKEIVEEQANYYCPTSISRISMGRKKNQCWKIDHFHEPKVETRQAERKGKSKKKWKWGNSRMECECVCVGGVSLTLCVCGKKGAPFKYRIHRFRAFQPFLVDVCLPLCCLSVYKIIWKSIPSAWITSPVSHWDSRLLTWIHARRENTSWACINQTFSSSTSKEYVLKVYLFCMLILL